MSIYMDHAATTPLRREVFEAMTPWLIEGFGNPSSVYALGRAAHSAVEQARDQVAAAIGAKSNEIYFTGSGSESDNWAIKGMASCKKTKGRHIVTTAIEHHAVLHTVGALEQQGFEITYLPVEDNGILSVDALEKALRDDTILVTVMMANNEIGTIQPVAEIGALCRSRGIAFHTDAVQAVGHLPIDVAAMNIDMLSLSAHKFGGPKGVGALYVRTGVLLPALINGGAQERGKRAGTENVAGIVGCGTALELAVRQLAEHSAHITRLRDRLIDGILAAIPDCRINGDRQMRLPCNVNISIRYIEGESLLLRLDMAGIAASSGSACTSGSLDPSHVLLAIGLPHEIAHGSLRLTLGWESTDEDVAQVLAALPPIVDSLRGMSPLFMQKTAVATKV